MRLRGGGWSDEQAHRRHEAEYQRAKERSGEAAAWTDRLLDQIAEGMDQLTEGNALIASLIVREPEIDFKRQRTPTERRKSEASRAASCRAEEGCRATEDRWLRQRRELKLTRGAATEAGKARRIGKAWKKRERKGREGRTITSNQHRTGCRGILKRDIK